MVSEPQTRFVDELGAYVIVIFDNKQMRLSSSTLSKGNQLVSQISAYEIESPYTLIISGSIRVQENLYDEDFQTLTFRMDVTRDDIIRELRKWLDGAAIENPCCSPSKNIENSMMKYVKLGNIPTREVLVLWILSRSELTKGFQPSAAMCFFGGKLKMDEKDDGEDLDAYYDPTERHLNPFSRTVDAALTSSPQRRSVNFGKRSDESFEPALKLSDSIDISANRTKRPISAPAPRYGSSRDSHKGYNSYETARKMLGKSQALAGLKEAKVKGRSEAAAVISKANLTEDHYRLGAMIERSRKFAEQDMENRRKIIEIAKARQKQAVERYTRLKEGGSTSHDAKQWLLTAESMYFFVLQITIEYEYDGLIFNIFLQMRSRCCKKCNMTSTRIFVNRRDSRNERR